MRAESANSKKNFISDCIRTTNIYFHYQTLKYFISLNQEKDNQVEKKL